MRALSICIVLFVLALAAPTRASEPAITPGLDPGGVAVALLGDGVNYTKPGIVSHLARDGEGDLIAWDFTDNDTRPYATASQSTKDAEELISRAKKIRLIAVKGAPGDPVAIGRMISFAVQTPARIIFCPDALSRTDMKIFLEGAKRFPKRLFIVIAPGKTPSEATKLTNLVIAPRGWALSARSGAYDVVASAIRALAAKPTLSIPELRKAVSP